MPNDDWRDDYRNIWLYDTEEDNAIASDPIEGKASPEERSILAFFSTMADDIARNLLKHSAAPEENEPPEPAQEPGPGCGCSPTCLENAVIIIVCLAVIVWWMSTY